jgi:bifunctional NMN adenylyltransferase/nudix hydrolase
MRGRMITFCHVIDVYSDTKPEVLGADDAAEAFWLPFDEVYKNKTEFFSDHYYILSKFYPLVEGEF